MKNHIRWIVFTALLAAGTSVPSIVHADPDVVAGAVAGGSAGGPVGAVAGGTFIATHKAIWNWIFPAPPAPPPPRIAAIRVVPQVKVWMSVAELSDTEKSGAKGVAGAKVKLTLGGVVKEGTTNNEGNVELFFDSPSENAEIKMEASLDGWKAEKTGTVLANAVDFVGLIQKK
jgi:hypothetical protein